MKYKKICIFLLCSFLLFFLYVEAKIFFYEDSSVPEVSDCILILGHALKDGDNEPSNWLEERLTTGFELYNANYAEYIIVSGGKGPDDKRAVSLAMKDWLIEKNVEAEVIITEENASNTYENFIFTKNIMKEKKFKSLIVVTNDFHMYRSMEIGKDVFANISAKSAYSEPDLEKFFAYIKEPFSLFKYKLKFKNSDSNFSNAF